MVCSDTGVGHLATAFGTPSVVLFGPNPPAWWGPPPQRRRHVALWGRAHRLRHGVRRCAEGE
nr:glycosyltransferase family 9 protein [Nocardia farcinica]